MHMYKLRLKVIITAFNKKQGIILTFKSAGSENYWEYEYFPWPNMAVFGQSYSTFTKVV